MKDTTDMVLTACCSAKVGKQEVKELVKDVVLIPPSHPPSDFDFSSDENPKHGEYKRSKRIQAVVGSLYYH